MRRPLAGNSVFLSLLVLTLMAGCAAVTDLSPYRLATADDDDVTGDDDDSGDDDDVGDDDDITPCDTSWLVEGDGEVSFTFQIEPLLLTRCDPCHTVQDLGGMRFIAPVRDALVDAPNLLGYGNDMPRVTAGDPEQSYVLHKLMGCDQQDDIWGYYGSYMPPPIGETVPLTTDELLLLYTWILQGAQDN